jgi:hypothetical protein
MDKFSGQGGDFEFDPVSRERRRKGEAPKAEPEGGGARDKDGKRLVEKTPERPEPALPLPGRAPWDVEPSAEAAPQPKKKGA